MKRKEKKNKKERKKGILPKAFDPLSRRLFTTASAGNRKSYIDQSEQNVLRFIPPLGLLRGRPRCLAPHVLANRLGDADTKLDTDVKIARKRNDAPKLKRLPPAGSSRAQHDGSCRIRQPDKSSDGFPGRSRRGSEYAPLAMTASRGGQTVWAWHHEWVQGDGDLCKGQKDNNTGAF